MHKHIKFDKVFIVGTQNSIWEAVYEDIANGDEDVAFKIFEAREYGNLVYFLPFIERQLDESLKTNGSKCYTIKYGINENELLENFEYFLDIAKNLNQKDEIYLDITHSFRSLSLMSFIMSEALSNLRQTPLNIKGVYYGMLEYSWENDGISPIVDLKIFFEFLEWSKAIRIFKQYGNPKDLLRLIQKDESLSDIKSEFIYFSNALNMSNMKTLQNSVATKIKPKLELLQNHKAKIFTPLTKELENFVKQLDVKSFALFQYNLAKWYLQNQNYALSYMVLQEALISAICEDRDFDLENEDDRKEAKKIIWEDRDLNKTFDKISKIRNSITHALKKGEKRPTDKDAINNLPLYMEKLKPVFRGRV